MSRSKKPNSEAEDDGRVIAPMNVDGMPWYIENGMERREQESGGGPHQMTKEEQRAFTWGVVKAGLLVVGVFAAAGFLFILFCLKVWFV